MEFEDSLKEYANPELYDLENQDIEPELSFFLEYVQRLGGPVLETGCGTGRLTIPLAQNGVDITGLDVVPAMVERAKSKAGSLPIQWVVADIREFSLPRKFKLIFETGSVFQHLLTRPDQEAYLARVREHLEDDGRFIFSLMVPQADQIISEESEKDWFTYQDNQGRTVRVSGTEHYDPLRQVKLETAYRRWTEEEGREVLAVAPLSLRYTFPQEIDTLLHYNGFEIETRSGGCDNSPLDEKSRMMLMVCRRRNK